MTGLFLSSHSRGDTEDLAVMLQSASGNSDQAGDRLKMAFESQYGTGRVVGQAHSPSANDALTQALSENILVSKVRRSQFSWLLVF